MSVHSRTSSEVETVPYADILPVFTLQFCRDFEFKDVQHYLKDLLKPEEFHYIIKEESKAQIFHMLWVLQNKSDADIISFLNCITDDYKWIVDDIKNVLRNHTTVTEEYLETLKRIRSDHQNFTDYNVHRTKPFMKLRAALRSLNPKTGLANVVLLGELGSGKKWLALDVCSEFTVLQAMNFKIFHIDTKFCNSPEEDLHALNTLMLKLNPNHHFSVEGPSKISYKILHLQKQLREFLKAKAFLNCLLVLTNVQNIKTLEAFNLGCKRLIITRNKKVSEKLSPKMNKHFNLEEGLSFTEFNLLLDKYIKKYDWREFANTNGTDIYYLSNGDPYVLSIIAKHLREKRSNWFQWQKYLENLQIPDKKFKRDIETSLKVLTPDQMRLYAVFAIFPHCVGIPVKLIAALWRTSTHEAEEIVYTFYKYSFIKRELLDDDDTVICHLKFVYSSYVKTCPTMQSFINQRDLHREIVKYYKVHHCLEFRSEVDLFCDKSLHDMYFFKYIGFHLLGAEYFDLFPKLYLDFGFLGQKMRSVGLLSSVADLKDYKREITSYDMFRAPILLNHIIDFLAKVEEKIFHIPDTCLLQGNFHQRRFIVNLMQTPKIVHILVEDLCIIVLENNDTYLVDISLDCSCGPLLIIKESVVNIVDVRLFGQENFMLTLDDHGQLKLWSIANERKRSLNQRRNSTKKFNPLNVYLYPSQLEMKKCKQQIDDMPLCKRDRVVAFYIELVSQHVEETYLHIALKNGDICVLVWNPEEEEFQRSYIPVLQTNFTNIRFICKILRKYYVLVNTSSSLSFWNLQDCSNVPTSFEWPLHESSLITYEIYSDVGPSPYTHLIFIFTDKILSLSFQKQRVTFLNGDMQVVLSNAEYHITCAKLSSDRRYLILGTKTGLVVYDVCTRSEIMRSIVSEQIRCVDVVDLDDKEYKCMIVCGVKHKRILYLLCLRKTGEDGLGWQHSSISGDVVLEEQTNIRLLGQKLFDVTYDEYTNVIAADSKNRVHQICTSDTKNWSIIKPAEITENISAIAAFKNWAFVGYQNGAIFNVCDESMMLPSFTNNAITYLKVINQHILVASSCQDELTLIKDLSQNISKKCRINTLFSYSVLENYLILINNYGAVVVFNANFNYLNHVDPEPHFCLSDSDFQNNTLFLASSCDYCIRILTCQKSINDDLELIQRPQFKRCEIECKLSCLAATKDASIIAVGLEIQSNEKANHHNGDIEVFHVLDNYDLQFVYCLKSHKSAVCDMKFSNKNAVLVSISEQLCIWNMAHVQNNPLNRDIFKRRSSRFSSQRSSELEEVDANILSKQYNRMFLSVQNDISKLIEPSKVTTITTEKSDYLDSSTDSVFDSSTSSGNCWEYYAGPNDKPELLACVKFDGNRAEQIFTDEDFTQFNTIDNEGVYYNLTLLTNNQQAFVEEVPNQTCKVVTNENNYLDRLSVISNNSGCDVVDAANT
uniref:NB-ARC domain-containing protein n=1 Tax=Glossina brevipalpis TaxID=37001 RepID=A0A1A9WXI7_9MUSC